MTKTTTLQYSPDINSLASIWTQNRLAENTRIAYASDWAHFTAWCERNSFVSLPATPEIVSRYLIELIAGNWKVTTAIRRTSSISHYHREAGHETPCDKTVWRLLSGARRERCEPAAQKRALSLDELRAMVAAVHGPRDRAILLLGFATALRRANLAGLDLDDVRIDERGAVVTVRHEKQDRVGKVRTIPVPRTGHDTCPVAALESWLAVRGDAPGLLFGIVPSRISIVVKRAAKQIGRDPAEYGAHSLRAGFVSEALAAGAGEIRVAAQTGHRSLQSLRLYYRPRDPYAGHPCAVLGL